MGNPGRGPVRLLAAGLIALGLLGAPAYADGDERASCELQAAVRNTPGFTLTTATSGRFFTETPGTAMCRGTLSGHELASSPGTFSISAGYDNSTCVAGVANGTLTLTLPTRDGGELRRDEKFHLTRVESLLYVESQMRPTRLQMVGKLDRDPRHADEDCVNKPLDHFLGTGRIVFNLDGKG